AAADSRVPGPDDPRCHPRPGVRGEMEEGLLRPPRQGLADGDGGLRRVGEPGVLRRREVRSRPAPGRGVALRPDPLAGRSPRSRSARLDRPGHEASWLALRGHGAGAAAADRTLTLVL